MTACVSWLFVSDSRWAETYEERRLRLISLVREIYGFVSTKVKKVSKACRDHAFSLRSQSQIAESFHIDFGNPTQGLHVGLTDDLSPTSLTAWLQSLRNHFAHVIASRQGETGFAKLLISAS